MSQNPIVRTTTAAALLIVPVVTEILVPTWFDGAAGKLAFAASQLLGWLLIWSVVRTARPGGARRARFGRGAVLTGAAFEIAFALVYGLTSFDGEPFEASFVLFSLGFLSLAVGGLSWGSALARVPGAGPAGLGLVATAVLGLLAILVASDPGHDIFLVASYAAWPLVGHGMATIRRPRTADPLRVASGSSLEG